LRELEIIKPASVPVMNVATLESTLKNILSFSA